MLHRSILFLFLLTTSIHAQEENVDLVLDPGETVTVTITCREEAATDTDEDQSDGLRWAVKFKQTISWSSNRVTWTLRFRNPTDQTIDWNWDEPEISFLDGEEFEIANTYPLGRIKVRPGSVQYVRGAVFPYPADSVVKDYQLLQNGVPVEGEEDW
ncbi:MAG: hypothetical protein OXT71_22930 [Acidobacteriota bacterium]|nr:hypothetical protein [Acidobacteriota bacterium]